MEDSTAVKTKSAAQQAAIFAMLAPVVSLILSCFVRTSAQTSTSEWETFTKALLVLLVTLCGVAAAIYALAAVRKQGREALLWRGIIGLGLNLVVLGLIAIGAIGAFVTAANSMAPLSKEQAMQLPQVIPGSTVIYGEQANYRMEIPEGFERTPDEFMEKQVAYQFTLAPEDGRYRLINIEHLDGIIDDQLIAQSDVDKFKDRFPPGSKLGVHQTVWNGRRVGGMAGTVPAEEGVTNYILNVQLPVRPQAVQINLAGPAQDKEALHALMDQLLAGFKATSNIRPNAQ